MLVSCLTVTQAGRLDGLRAAIGDFARQTHADRELIVVHDGDAALDGAVRALAAAAAPAEAEAPVRVLAVPGPASLGALRNRAVDAARGEFVCQWDDDDRCHPLRIELQLRALVAEAAEFCFLVDQLHWFPASGDLSWDDWNKEPWPLNFVQGTLLGRRAAMPRYPELARGEDTALCRAILEAGHRIARLRGAGWCYVYVFHGRNAWPLAHHLAIAQMKAFGAARLLGSEKLLRERLAEYVPGLGAAVLTYPGGQIRIGGSGRPDR